MYKRNVGHIVTLHIHILKLINKKNYYFSGLAGEPSNAPTGDGSTTVGVSGAEPGNNSFVKILKSQFIVKDSMIPLSPELSIVACDWSSGGDSTDVCDSEDDEDPLPTPPVPSKAKEIFCNTLSLIITY